MATFDFARQFQNSLQNSLANSSSGENPFGLQDLEGTDTGLRAIFEQARPEFLKTTGQRDIFSSLFDRIINDFLGEAGESFRVGEMPEQSFTDFLQGIDTDRLFRRETASGRSPGLASAANFLFRT